MGRGFLYLFLNLNIYILRERTIEELKYAYEAELVDWRSKVKVYYFMFLFRFGLVDFSLWMSYIVLKTKKNTNVLFKCPFNGIILMSNNTSYNMDLHKTFSIINMIKLLYQKLWWSLMTSNHFYSLSKFYLSCVYLPIFLSYLPIFLSYLPIFLSYLPIFLSYLPIFLSYIPIYLHIFLSTYLSILSTYPSMKRCCLYWTRQE